MVVREEKRRSRREERRTRKRETPKSKNVPAAPLGDRHGRLDILHRGVSGGRVLVEQGFLEGVDSFIASRGLKGGLVRLKIFLNSEVGLKFNF